jgi:nucleoid DNA-binding protein
MRIEAFITDLLYDHDCVIIPGFGGLVANYRSARLNRMTHVIKPPSKHVGFNRNLTHNDGLLVACVSRMTGMSYADAMKSVEETVADCLHRLNQGERIMWDRIGLFFRDRSGGLQFVPEDQENFLPEAFGLTAVQLRPVIRQSAPMPVAEESEVAVIAHPAASKGWWKAAAAVAVPLLAAGAFLYLSQGKNMGGLQMAEFNPFKQGIRNAVYETLPERETMLAWDTAQTAGWEALLDKPGVRINLLTGEEDARGVEVGSAKPAPVVRKATAPKKASGLPKYLVIAGAFEQSENASNFIAQLKADGYNAFAAGKRGRLHLVAIAGADSEFAARDTMRQLKAESRISAWLLRR